MGRAKATWKAELDCQQALQAAEALFALKAVPGLQSPKASSRRHLLELAARRAPTLAVEQNLSDVHAGFRFTRCAFRHEVAVTEGGLEKAARLFNQALREGSELGPGPKAQLPWQRRCFCSGKDDSAFRARMGLVQAALQADSAALSFLAKWALGQALEAETPHLAAGPEVGSVVSSISP